MDRLLKLERFHRTSDTDTDSGPGSSDSEIEEDSGKRKEANGNGISPSAKRPKSGMQASTSYHCVPVLTLPLSSQLIGSTCLDNQRGSGIAWSMCGSCQGSTLQKQSLKWLQILLGKCALLSYKCYQATNVQINSIMPH